MSEAGRGNPSPAVRLASTHHQSESGRDGGRRKTGEGRTNIDKEKGIKGHDEMKEGRWRKQAGRGDKDEKKCEAGSEVELTS